MDTAHIRARGDAIATFGTGGTINVRSAMGSVSWQNGLGDVRPTGLDNVPPDNGVPAANRGLITIQAASTVTTTGTSFPFNPPPANTTPTSPVIVQNTPSDKPTVPFYVVFPLCEPVGEPPKFDFGDAPENPIVPGDYPTTLANDGARHRIVPNFHLGATIDDEPDGQPNGTATGDDDNPMGTDDEDGVVFNGPFVPGLTTSITVTVTDPGNLGGKLSAWFDWNGDGDWLDLGEQVFTDLALADGSHNLNVMVPLTAVVAVNGAPTFARFRFSTQMGLASTGLAIDGEVEDYKLFIYPYWTSKCAVITQIGECFAIPDVLVDVDNGPLVFDVTKVGTLMPATRSIQAAIDYVNANGDVNGDGKLLVAVTARDTLVESAACGGIPFIGRDLGGSGIENFVITNPSGQQLYVMGNSVTINAADPSKPVATIKSSVGKVTAMDIHAAGSNVAGYLVGGAGQQNAGSVLVKNTSATNNVGGVGIWVYDDVVEVSGSQHVSGNRVGIQVNGDKNVLRTNNEIIKNSEVGIRVVGNNNEVRDQDVGKSGNANGAGIEVVGSSNKVYDGTVAYNNGIGIKITGNSNTVSGEDVWNNLLDAIWASGNSNQILGNNIFSNGGDGVDVAGNSNIIQKNTVGEKAKGNAGDGIRVAGDLNQILENYIYANLGRGIDVIGLTAGTPGGNILKKNVVGDKSKGGNGNDGIRVSGKNNTIEANTVNANKGYGIYIAGSTSTGNKLKDNKSNTDSSGGASENLLAEYKFEAAITNQGGNKKDNANFTATAIGTYE